MFNNQLSVYAKLKLSLNFLVCFFLCVLKHSLLFSIDRYAKVPEDEPFEIQPATDSEESESESESETDDSEDERERKLVQLQEQLRQVQEQMKVSLLSMIFFLSLFISFFLLSFISHQIL